MVYNPFKKKKEDLTVIGKLTNTGQNNYNNTFSAKDVQGRNYTPVPATKQKNNYSPFTGNGLTVVGSVTDRNRNYGSSYTPISKTLGATKRTPVRNYTPSTNKRIETSVPTPQAPQAPPQNKLQQMSSEAVGLLGNQNQAYQDYLNRINAQQQGMFKNQIEDFEKRRDQSVDLIKKGAQGIEVSGQRQIQNAQTREGENLRALAQTKREQDVARQRKFGALGTLESGGYFGYTGQQSLGDRDLIRNQTALKQQTQDDIALIQEQMFNAQINAENQINETIGEYNAIINSIQNDATLTSMEKDYAIQQAQQDFDNKAFDIRQGLVSSLAELESAAADRELKMQELNLKYADELRGEDTAGKEELKGILDQILLRNTDAITGLKGITNYIPGSDAQMTKNMVNQLISMLTLENISKLKGTGQISDKEQEILRAASTSLGTNLSNEDFRNVLSSLRAGLGGGDTNTNTGGNTFQVGGYTVQVEG